MSTIQVALIASSGGGVATIGHTQVEEQLQTLEDHLQLIHAKLSYAIHISLLGGKSMDSVDPETDHARLTIVKPRNSSSAALECKVEATDTLERINLRAFELQKLLAEEIRSGKVDALICTSIHVPLFVNVLQAAADRKLVVIGSGGTSLALATVQFPGLKLCGNSGGSVATTTQTRVISYTYGIAQAYRREHLYKPWKSQKHSKKTQQISWTSVLNGALPAFWAVMMTKYLLTSVAPQILMFSPWLAWSLRERQKEMEFVHSMLDHFVLPAVCSILMATSNHDHTRSATSFASLTMAAIVASFGCRDSVIAGLVAGYLVKQSIERVIYNCVFVNIPATMTTLLAGGGTGSTVGLVSCFVVAPITRMATFLIRWMIQQSVTTHDSNSMFPLFAAFGWGCLSCWSSKVGYYHALHLPLIFLELEGGRGSFLGAVDELTLVLVCAGVCAAMTLTTESDTDQALCKRGLLINLMAGDFVEVCYPYMAKSVWINLSGYLASGLSCVILVHLSDAGQAPVSFAYLPFPIAVALADNNWWAMLCASFVAFFIPFGVTLIVSPLLETSEEKKSQIADEKSEKVS